MFNIYNARISHFIIALLLLYFGSPTNIWSWWDTNWQGRVKVSVNADGYKRRNFN